MSRTARTAFRHCSVTCAVVALCAAQLWAQTSTPPASKAPPPHMVYHLFFTHVNFLGQKALEAEKAGKPGDPLRKFYQKKIGLTEVEHNALLKRAASCEDEVVKQDAAAVKLVQQLRRQNLPSRVPGSPPQSPELNQMQAQRDTLIQGHIAQLKIEMGNTGFQKVDTFLNGEFIRHTSMQSAPSNQAASLTAKRAASLRVFERR